MSAARHLFVYGTLRPQTATVTAAWLQHHTRLIGTGKVQGRLYLVTYYPGLVLSSDSSEWVTGDVLEVLAPRELYPELDKYEGCGPNDPQPCEYRRVPVRVLIDPGWWIDATTYQYQWSVDGCERITSGDFLMGS